MPVTSQQLNELRRRIQQHMDKRMWSEACSGLQELLRITPENVAARFTLARLQLQTGQLHAATKTLLEVARQGPLNAAMAAALAQALDEVGETVAAVDCLSNVSAKAGVPREIAVQLAHAHFNLGLTGAALAWLERAMQHTAAVAEDQHFQAMLLQFMGKKQQAEALLDACLQRWPGFGSAALTRARLRTQTKASHHIDSLRVQVDRSEAGSLNQAAFLFALFKELADLGQHDDAWTALRQANVTMHARNPYDEDLDVALWRHTLRYMDEDVCRPATGQSNGPLPIFIVGMPRSGSTLLDRMLGNHSAVTSAGEISDLFKQWCQAGNIGGNHPREHLAALEHRDKIDFDALGRSYLNQTAWRADGRARFIDKMPNNFQFVGLIHRAIPGARILNIVREPMAVCFSNFKAMFGDSSPHCYEQRLLGRFYLRQEALRQHWHQVVPGAMLDVAYADLVKTPRETMRKVMDFCALDLEEACLDPSRNQTPVTTPSSAQVQGPIHQRGLDEWRHYASHLQPLQETIDAGPG